MLVAEKNYDFSLEQELIIDQPKKTVKTISKKGKFKAISVSCLLIFFVVALFFVSRVITVTSKGFEVIKLEREIHLLQVDNERLELEIAELGSLDRIEKIAMNDLKMIKPEVGDIEFIPKKDKVSGQEQANADTTVKVNKDENTSQNIWSKTAALFNSFIKISSI